MILIGPDRAAAGADLLHPSSTGLAVPLLRMRRRGGGGTDLPLCLVEANVADHVGDLLVVGVVCGRTQREVKNAQ